MSDYATSASERRRGVQIAVIVILSGFIVAFLLATPWDNHRSQSVSAGPPNGPTDSVLSGDSPTVKLSVSTTYYSIDQRPDGYDPIASGLGADKGLGIAGFVPKPGQDSPPQQLHFDGWPGELEGFPVFDPELHRIGFDVQTYHLGFISDATSRNNQLMAAIVQEAQRLYASTDVSRPNG